MRLLDDSVGCGDSPVYHTADCVAGEEEVYWMRSNYDACVALYVC